jgi:hypothetical protein
VVGVVVILQDVLDIVGMAKEIHAAGAESHRDHVTVLAPALKEEPKWVPTGHGEHAHEWIAAWARRRSRGVVGRCRLHDPFPRRPKPLTRPAPAWVFHRAIALSPVTFFVYAGGGGV